MSRSNRRTSTTTKEHVRSTGPRIIFGWGRVATRARIDMTSKPDVEYMGKHGGGGTLSPTLVITVERTKAFGRAECGLGKG